MSILIHVACVCEFSPKAHPSYKRDEGHICDNLCKSITRSAFLILGSNFISEFLNMLLRTTVKEKRKHYLWTLKSEVDIQHHLPIERSTNSTRMLVGNTINNVTPMGNDQVCLLDIYATAIVYCCNTTGFNSIFNLKKERRNINSTSRIFN